MSKIYDRYQACIQLPPSQGGGFPLYGTITDREMLILINRGTEVERPTRQQIKQANELKEKLLAGQTAWSGTAIVTPIEAE